jgi:hypothetical protein
MLEVLHIILVLCFVAIAYCLGDIHEIDREEKRLSARVIRPANITVNRHYHVTEYVVSDSKALELDYPDSKVV